MGERILGSLIQWAEAESDVRGAVLIGSRAAPDARLDGLSDYDIVLFVRDVSAYGEADGWVDAFGRVLLVRPDRYELLGRSVPTRLVQYEGGLRIDFSLCRLALLDRLMERPRLPAMFNAGYRVLVDKDERLAPLPPPTGSAHVPGRPSEAEFRGVVDEFWWEALYVAKHLSRGELLPARYSGECVLRYSCLVPMLEWYVEGTHGWSEPVGPHGRGVARLLGAEDRRRLERTYAGAGPTENWEALFATTELFSRLTRSVGEELGYPDVGAVGEEVEDLLCRIRSDTLERGHE